MSILAPRRSFGPAVVSPLLALVLAPAALAQDGGAAVPAADTSTPEATTVAMVTALKAQDWDASVELMHPEALEELRGLFLPILQHAETAEVRGMFGVATPEEAASLTGADVYRSLMALSTSGDPTTAAALRSVEADVVGHLMEGDTAHVVYHLKMQVDEIPFSQTAVASLRQHDGRWLGLLTADLRGMIAGMQQALDTGNFD